MRPVLELSSFHFSRPEELLRHPDGCEVWVSHPQLPNEIEGIGSVIANSQAGSGRSFARPSVVSRIFSRMSFATKAASQAPSSHTSGANPFSFTKKATEEPFTDSADLAAADSLENTTRLAPSRLSAVRTRPMCAPIISAEDDQSGEAAAAAGRMASVGFVVSASRQVASGRSSFFAAAGFSHLFRSFMGLRQTTAMTNVAEGAGSALALRPAHSIAKSLSINSEASAGIEMGSSGLTCFASIAAWQEVMAAAAAPKGASNRWRGCFLRHLKLDPLHRYFCFHHNQGFPQ